MTGRQIDRLLKVEQELAWLYFDLDDKASREAKRLDTILKKINELMYVASESEVKK